MPMHGPWRRLVLRAIIVVAVVALLAVQVVPPYQAWRSNPFHGGLRDFLNTAYRNALSLNSRIWVVSEPGHPAEVFEHNPLRGPDSSALPAAARVLRVDGSFIASEHGRLRYTATRLYTEVKVEVVRPGLEAGGGPGTSEATDEERRAARPLLAQHPAGSLTNEVGTFTSAAFLQYGERPAVVYRWRALALTVGQVLLAVMTVGVLVWVLIGLVRDIRRVIRARRLERGLCPACRYPSPASDAPCPECGVRSVRSL